MKPSGIITLTTDFGLRDPYVGIMKGVILSINPAARPVDITHHIRAGSIFQASNIIQEAYSFFPEGTIHVAVVDPGVGSLRRLLLVETDAYLFVGPDNGIFWPVITSPGSRKTIEITRKEYFLPHITHTFHGRDIFAPVAAHLSLGVPPAEMGRPLNDPVPLPVPKPRQSRESLSGQVIRVDHFGNLITNIRRQDLDRFAGQDPFVIHVGDLRVTGIRKTYADVRAGEPLAMIGSSGLMEIAVNLGRACDRLDLNFEDIPGTRVEVKKTL